VLEEAHGIDSTRFQLVANHLNRERINAVRHQTIVFQDLLKYVPWAVFDRAVDETGADADPRCIKSRAHFIAMLHGQLTGARGLREIEANLKSHASKLPHLGGCVISKSALRDSNLLRPFEIFARLLSALMLSLQAGYRRKIGDCVRLIDSTSVKLSNLSGKWATFSEGVCGAKAHMIYDPDTDQPLYLMVTPSNVNDITAAKQMPTEAGATYVFDLGYYDYAWWAKLDQAECRIVTRLKSNTPFTVKEERPVPPGSDILSDRTGYLPSRLSTTRKNPMSKLVREIQVRIQTGKVLRIFTNDLTASAQEIADLYKPPVGHRAVLPLGQADLEDHSLLRDLRERRPYPDRSRADRFLVAAPRSRGQQNRRKPAHLRPAHPGQPDAPAADRGTSQTPGETEAKAPRI
jgi:hypothetical protein